MSRLLLYRARSRSRKTRLCGICQKYVLPDFNSAGYRRIDNFYSRNELILCDKCRSPENIAHAIQNIYERYMLKPEIIHLVEYCCKLDLIDLLLLILRNFPFKNGRNSCRELFIEDIDNPSLHNTEPYSYIIEHQFIHAVDYHNSKNVTNALLRIMPKKFAKHFKKWIKQKVPDDSANPDTVRRMKEFSAYFGHKV